MRLNRIDESVADQIMMSVASMSPVALVGTMTAGAILGDKFLKFLRGDELAQMKRKIERDPAAFDFVEDMRADRKFKKLKRIVNKLARDVKKNPDDPEFKTLFKKAAAELNAYFQTEYKKHSKKFKSRYRGTKVGRQAMRQMMGIKEDAQLHEAESLSWNKMKDNEKKELVDLARVSPRAAFMDWNEIPSSMKARLAKYLNQSTKGEYRLVEDKYGPYGGPPPLEFDPDRYGDHDGDGTPNYDDPDYPRDPRYYPNPHPDNIPDPDPFDTDPTNPDNYDPADPDSPYSNPFGYKRPAPGFYDPYFDPYVPVLPTPGATEPLDPPTEPVIPGTDPSSPFPFGLPFPYRPQRPPFAPGEPLSPIHFAGTQMESMKLDERAKVPTYVIDRKTKKIVHGPTDTADAKLYLDKQITPRKFMIRQIRGAAKKVGDTV